MAAEFRPADGSAPTVAGKPFVFAFSTEKGGCYVYDANTNRILQTSDAQFAAVVARLAPADSNGDSTEPLLPLQKCGLMCGPAVEPTDVIGHRRCLEAKIDTSLSQLTLELTEACNLRCGYCVYGSGYVGQRPHGVASMSPDVARQALDYFYSHNGSAPNVSLGFYGGEPLVAWDTLRDVVVESSRYPRGRDTHIHMTTNGTLLTREKFSFLVEKQIALLVSLDGPRAIHDQYRRTGGGRPTFDRITSNLRALRRYDPAYYKRNVSFSIVRVPGTPLDTIIRFFSENPLTRNQSLQISGVSSGSVELDRTFERLPKNGDRDGDLVLLREFLVDVLRSARPTARHRALQAYFGRRFITLHRRNVCDCDTAAGLNGMCTPGWRKLFVARDGTLFTCERVRREWPIGHISTGIDLERVFEYLGRHLAFTRRRCRSCWAIRLCGACQSTIGGPQGIDEAKLDRFCEAERREVADMIKLYTRVLERDPTAFDFVEDISVS